MRNASLLLAAAIGSTVLAAGCSGSPDLAAGGFGGGATVSSSSVNATSNEETSGCGFCGDEGASTSSSSTGEGGALGAPTDNSPVVMAATPPKPVSGGAMFVAADGAFVASDSDRDAITWTTVDATTGARTATRLALTAGDEPGRLVEDAAGLVHVVLRSGGGVATVDRAAGVVLRRASVCAAPRGIAYDADRDALLVACVDGTLATIAAADDSPIATTKLADDLRDVVALGQGLFAVSRFRSAELLLVSADGTVLGTSTPQVYGDVSPDVAWRITAVPGLPSAVAMTHQLATSAPIDLEPLDGYSSNGQIVTSAFTLFQYDLANPSAAPVTKLTLLDAGQIQGGPLPVDVAFDSIGRHVAVAFFGASEVSTFTLASDGSFENESTIASVDVASVAFGADGFLEGFDSADATFARLDDIDPATYTPSAAVDSLADTGRSLFHLGASNGAVACASCHPEGRDDGRVWNFVQLGDRRTPSLVGGVLATAPFHWQGELADLPALVDEVYTRRMGGPKEDAAHVVALARFLDAIPRIPLATPQPSASIDHGDALFHSADVGCGGCHSGAHLTSNLTVDVGTGAAFQVPSLVGVSQRGPWLHDGCAETLLDRFDPDCGGENHGQTGQLSAGDLADLVAYLETL